MSYRLWQCDVTGGERRGVRGDDLVNKPAIIIPPLRAQLPTCPVSHSTMTDAPTIESQSETCHSTLDFLIIFTAWVCWNTHYWLAVWEGCINTCHTGAEDGEVRRSNKAMKMIIILIMLPPYLPLPFITAPLGLHMSMPVQKVPVLTSWVISDTSLLTGWARLFLSITCHRWT